MSQQTKWRSFVHRRPSEAELQGIVRRGLAETTGEMPMTEIEINQHAEGRNPYDSDGAFERSNPRRQTPTRKSDTESDGNPYDTAIRYHKGLGWDDVTVDVIEKD